MLRILFFIFLCTNLFSEYYNSNSLGQKKELVQNVNAAKFVVKSAASIIKNQKIENNILYFEGKFSRKWVRYYDNVNNRLLQEEEYLKENLLFIRYFDIDGNVIKEIQYKPKGSVLLGTMYYTYKDGFLIKKTFQPNSNSTPYVDNYYYTYNGNIRKVIRVDNNKNYYRYNYYPDNILKNEWQKNSKSTKRTYYDYVGRVLKIIINQDTGNIFYTYKYLGDNKLPNTEKIAFDDGHTTINKFDGDGNLLSNMLYKGREKISIKRYGYDFKKRLIKEETIKDSTVITFAYSYKPNDKINSATKIIDNKIQKISIYKNDNDWVDSVFRNGSLILKAYYKDSKLVKQQDIKNGKIISTQEFDY